MRGLGGERRNGRLGDSCAEVYHEWKSHGKSRVRFLECRMSNTSNNHSDPVVVAKYPTEFEAILSKNMLTEAGIPVEVVGAMTAGFRAETPGFVKVLVPGEFAEKALELLIDFTHQAKNSQDDNTDEQDEG